ncbi:transposase [Candidatus Wolfebacteria bacterium]|nr:transposase [Candidatus Wolfebacteria bacterium]
MELIHVLNRGVDKRKIFLNEKDYFRFIHDLFEFNDQEPADISSYLFRKQYSVVGRPNIRERERKPRKLLVNLLAFCLMPNHYHLFLTPKIKNGTALFMKKLNAGYSRYFNEKYKRKGTLFEGKYKRIIIKDEAHFIHLPYYIHYNPLDLIMPEWRQRKLENYKKATEFLEKYRWSSHLDYLGKNNFPSVTQREFLLGFFKGHDGYKNNMKEWLKELDIWEIKKTILE